MRMRRVIAALAFSVVTVLSMSGVAHASPAGEPPTTIQIDPTKLEGGVNGDVAKCIRDDLAAGKKVDDCQKAPSPILPAKNEIIWGSISFVVLLLALWKFAWPGLKGGLAARSDRIRADLDAAESAKAEADRVLDEYKAQLADARNESARIIEEARQAADTLRKDQEQRLQAELAQLRERAAADIESAKRQAVGDLRGEVAQLAIGAAEVIVQHNLDAATQAQLVESYIDQVLSRSN